jgi:hypothetical protein
MVQIGRGRGRAGNKPKKTGARSAAKTNLLVIKKSGKILSRGIVVASFLSTLETYGVDLVRHKETKIKPLVFFKSKVEQPILILVVTRGTSTPGMPLAF